jgi:hypothetical protein
MINGKITCPKCSTHFEISLTTAPTQQAEDAPRSEAPNPPPIERGSSLAELLDSINDDALTGAAAKFVTETRERFNQYGDRIRMSEKQLAWLKRIATGEDQAW